MFTLSTQKKSGRRLMGWTLCLTLAIALVSTALCADPISFTVYDFSLASPDETAPDAVRLDHAPSIGHFTVDTTTAPSGTGQPQSIISIARQGSSGHAPSRPSGNTSTRLQHIKKPNTEATGSKDKDADNETPENDTPTASPSQQCSVNADLPNILQMPDGTKVTITLTQDANNLHAYYLDTNDFVFAKHNNTPLDIGNRHDEVLTSLHKLTTSWNYHYWYQHTELNKAIQTVATLWNNAVSDLLLGVNCDWLIEAVVVVNQDNTEEATLTGFHFQHEQTDILIQFDNPPGLAPPQAQTTHLAMHAPIHIHHPQADDLFSMTFAGDGFVMPPPNIPSPLEESTESPDPDGSQEEPEDDILGEMDGLTVNEPTMPIVISGSSDKEVSTAGIPLDTLGKMFQAAMNDYNLQQLGIFASVPGMNYEQKLKLRGFFPRKDDDKDGGDGDGDGDGDGGGGRAGAAKNVLRFYSN